MSLEQGDTCTRPGGARRGSDTGRPPTHDEHVDRGDDRYLSRGLGDDVCHGPTP